MPARGTVDEETRRRVVAWLRREQEDQALGSIRALARRLGLSPSVATSRCSANDCELVALAEELGVPLVTSDRQVLAEFPDLARSPEAFLAAG